MMKSKMLLTKVASAIILTLSVAGCARFETRLQADGDFNYQNVEQRDQYKTGAFSHDEQRTIYDINALSKQQAKLGLLGKDVDIRPPTQLIPVLEGVLLDPDMSNTKVWFNAFNQDDQMEEKVWGLAIQYLASQKVTPLSVDRSSLKITTGPVLNKNDYGSLSKNYVHDKADYTLQLARGDDGRSMSLAVDVHDYQETNDGVPVKQVLAGRTKRSIEIRFINDMLRFAAVQKEENALKSLDSKPLPIKLGFDDNHQTAWIIDTEFLDAWRKLPDLLQLMSFEPVQSNKNLGYFLVKFVPQDTEYWLSNNLNAINLEKAEYFVQLGELTGGETSLIWLNAEKQALTEQQVTNLYLSITDNIRSVIIENDKQTKRF